jgi:putative transposase
MRPDKTLCGPVEMCLWYGTSNPYRCRLPMSGRTNPRHEVFDYRTSAAYFVMICAHERRCRFGTVQRGRMVLNERGKIVAEEWERSEAMRDEMVLDAFAVMPNHLHGIVCLVPADVDDVSPRGYDLDVGPHGDAALQGGDNHPRREDGCPQRHAKSLGSMIAGFKGAVTARINEYRNTPGAPVWQSRYHDRILRNEREWRACRRYIERNPGRWAEDRYHPAR